MSNSLAYLALLLPCAVWVVVLTGPEPWRAIRGAWFWLSMTLIGSIVFLLAAGPTPGLSAPRSPNRRLTGGWAFILTLVLMSILTPDR